MKRESLEKVGKAWASLNVIWFSMFFSLLLLTMVGILLKGYIGVSFEEKTLSSVRTLFYLLTIITVSYSVYVRNFYMKKAKEEKGEFALETYRRAIVLALGISESIGIFGLLLLLIGDRFYGFPLVITAGLVMLYHRPRRGEMLSLLEKD
jgi:hypothetical protein